MEIEKKWSPENGGKNSHWQEGSKQNLKTTNDATSYPKYDSVDFVYDQDKLTDLSLAYLRDLAKHFARLPDSRIILQPMFRNEQQYNQENADIEHGLWLKRQFSIRKVLVASGFPSDHITFALGNASSVGIEVRFDNNDRRIESGMMVESWP